MLRCPSQRDHLELDRFPSLDAVDGVECRQFSVERHSAQAFELAREGERNRMIEQREVFPADYFLSSARIKNLSEVGKAWNRNRVESSAFPCFPIAFIKIGAPLNRARYWSKPFMFSLKPRGLLDCVVAGQMKIFPIGRTRQGGISEKRPDSNVPLKFSQLNA